MKPPWKCGRCYCPSGDHYEGRGKARKRRTFYGLSACKCERCIGYDPMPGEGTPVLPDDSGERSFAMFGRHDTECIPHGARP